MYSLAPGTAIGPDIPTFIARLLFPFFSNLRRRETFIVPVVPFPDILRDLDSSARSHVRVAVAPRGLPREFILASELE